MYFSPCPPAQPSSCAEKQEPLFLVLPQDRRASSMVSPKHPKGSARTRSPSLGLAAGDISRLCAAGLRDAAFPPLAVQGTLLLQPPSRRDPKSI